MTAQTKQRLRARLIELRAKQDAAFFPLADARLARNLEQFFSSRSRGLWAAYRPLPREASMELAIPNLKQRGLEFCFPRVVDADQGIMDFFLIQNWESDFVQHPWGMLEPRETCQIVAKEKIVGVFVPLLGFDRHGTRLGKGRAFYDRYLSNFRGRKVGIGYEWQYSPVDIPRESHDIGLDAVVTESKIHRF